MMFGTLDGTVGDPNVIKSENIRMPEQVKSLFMTKVLYIVDPYLPSYAHRYLRINEDC